jgi:hypothetical protein
MGLVEILELVKALFQMPATILEFVRIMRKTPVERHEDLLKKIAQEAKRFEETGRPS